MNKILSVFTILILIIAMGAIAEADLMTLQPDNGTDTSISNYNESSPDMNFGSHEKMVVGGTDRSLVEFDFSSLGNATISNATLSLWHIGVPTSNMIIDVHRITSFWDESTVTWNTMPSYDSSSVSSSNCLSKRPPSMLKADPSARTLTYFADNS